MPRFSANLSLLYTDLPFLERFHAAKAGGFEAVECQFPYEYSSGAKLHEILAVMQALGLTMDLHNLPAGDWSLGDRGIACDPSRVKSSKLVCSMPFSMQKLFRCHTSIVYPAYSQKTPLKI